VYGAPGDDPCHKKADAYCAAAHIIHELIGKRVLMLGRRTPGMTPTAFEEQVLMKKLGVSIATMGLDEMDKFIRDNACEAEAQKIWGELASKASSNVCPDADGVQSVKNYLGIKKYLTDNRYSAVAIGSYPDCQGTMCLPISLLTDDRIPAGCEGDMPSTILMLILSTLSEFPVHFGEMLAFDETDGTIISSHCGAAALGLADERGYNFCPVRLANRGVCVRHCCGTGEVTYVNMLGANGKLRICAIEGTAVPTEMVFEGNPLRIAANAGRDDILQAVSEHGFSHHWMTVYRHAADALRAFCEMAGIMFVQVDDKGIHHYINKER